MTLLIILLRHHSWGYVINILQPLEVGASDTTTIDEHVWCTDDSSFDKDLFSGKSGWAVSTFEDCSALKIWCVAKMNTFLDGGGHQVVNLCLEVAQRILGLNLVTVSITVERAVLH